MNTHTKTEALLLDNNYFGFGKEQIVLMKQEKVPALMDSEARFAMKGDYELITKPHGHGDVHSLIASYGLAEQWQKEGRKYVVCFQDTNAMCFDSVPSAIGVALEQEFDVVSICVPRKAGEAVGAIATLVREDSHDITICIEYNQLTPLLV